MGRRRKDRKTAVDVATFGEEFNGGGTQGPGPCNAKASEGPCNVQALEKDTCSKVQTDYKFLP